jgi:hypothetical protein
MISPMCRTDHTSRVSRAVPAGVLAACMLINPAMGVVTWLCYKKAAVKEEVAVHIRSGIEDSDLVVLEFTFEEARTLLRWEDSREFEYDGHMYDIVETQVLGHTVLYKCWWDNDETRLNDRLRELASQDLGELFCLEGDEERSESSPMTSHGAVVCDWRISDSGFHRHWRLFPGIYPSVIISPPTPPPRPA